MNFIAQLAGVVAGLSVAAIAHKWMRPGIKQDREKQLAEGAAQLQELTGMPPGLWRLKSRERLAAKQAEQGLKTN